MSLYRDLWSAAKDVIQGDPIQVVATLKAEIFAAKATNEEDLAKLSEAVSLGAKQAAEFDALFDGAIQERDDAVAKADANRQLAEQWRACARKLYKIPHSLECDRELLNDAWSFYRKLSQAEPDVTEGALPAKLPIVVPATGQALSSHTGLR